MTLRTARGLSSRNTQSNQSRLLFRAEVVKHFRRLKGNEMVSIGDFVMDERETFIPWEGPTGFRANAFIKPIYRRDKSRSLLARKPE